MSQSLGEGEVNIRIDLDLVNPLQFVFHRVFQRDNFDIGCVDFFQAGVKRSGFPTPGRSRGEDNAVRFANHSVKKREVILSQTEFGEPEFNGLPVEDTEDDTLAVKRCNSRDCRYTQVDLPVPDAADLSANFAILRPPPFGDIHPRHNFDTRGNGGLQIRGRLRLVLQDTVHAKPNLELRRIGLNVDVARAHADSIDDHLVYGVNHRRVLTEVLLVNAEVINSLAFKSIGCADRAFDTGTQQAFRGSAVKSDNCLVNFRFIGEERGDLAIGDELDFVNEHHVQHICHCDGEDIAV